jgi:hypothetical protein
MQQKLSQREILISSQIKHIFQITFGFLETMSVNFIMVLDLVLAWTDFPTRPFRNPTTPRIILFFFFLYRRELKKDKFGKGRSNRRSGREEKTEYREGKEK